MPSADYPRVATEPARRNLPTAMLWDRNGIWPNYGETLTAWEGRLIDQMVRSLDAVSQFVEFDTVVLSSYASEEICRGICRRLESTLADAEAIAGNITPSPKAVGAASLPFSSRFTVE